MPHNVDVYFRGGWAIWMVLVAVLSAGGWIVAVAAGTPWLVGDVAELSLLSA